MVGTPRVRRWPVVLRVLVAASVGCGRLGFDPASGGPGDVGDAGLGSEGCGLRDLAVGGTSTCAVTGSGALWCWGALGGGATPAEVPLPGPATRVALTHGSVCALLETGQIACFGANWSGELGRGTVGADPGGLIAGGRTYRDLAGARETMCAVSDLGIIDCWGADSDGLLGDGDAPITVQPTPTPVRFDGRGIFETIASSSRAMCATATGGGHYCWGWSPFADTPSTSQPVPVAEARPLALGRGTACMLAGGDVQCTSTAGVFLGDGQPDTGARTGEPVGLREVVAVTGGARQFCAVEADGELWCWGDNRSGELGTGDLARRGTPARIDVPPVRRAATAYAHACAETTDGVYCWGGNRGGELGRGTTSISLPGEVIPGIPSPVAVATGGRSGFGCALTAAGEVWCWGQGASGVTGDLGLGWSPTPRRIALPFVAVEVGVGSGFACARSASEVACWGEAADVRLGTALVDDQPLPVLVPGLTPPVTQLSVGAYGACAIANQEARCWGLSMSATKDVAAVTGLPPVKAITPPTKENGHMCALTLAGEAWCWGSNTDNALGRGAAVGDPLVPAPVLGGRAYSAIAVTTNYRAKTCAIPDGGAAEVDCWGAYDQGSVDVPTVRSLSSVPAALRAGGELLCALYGDGSRECVGDGSYGQLGDGQARSSTTFAPAGAPAATAVGLGGTSACFVESGVVRCVGDGRHGALGVVPGATPVRVPLTCE